MPTRRATLAASVRPAAYGLLGLVATAVLGLVTLNLTTGVQHVIYRALYGMLGPTAATQVAMVWHFALAALFASTLPAISVAYHHRGTPGVRALTPGIVAIIGTVALFALLSGARIVPYLGAVALLAVALTALPILLHHRDTIESPALATLCGAVPVVVLMVLLLGFGMGWGWGYVLVAETTDAPAVSNGTVAEFDTVPTVRGDLFTENRCSAGTDGGQQCTLSLRGYDHEAAAVRFLATHGVRCPYVNVPPGTARDPGSFIAEHDGTYYRVTCDTHGD